ncbi:hypothetical protein N7452_002518 [Penicillium brevicompactum]|uniref:Zn(2)-C6 fungal-type domain-containing protein n=1 Tax=Penicillium brevicompactum TaxID=5074 RepID=A0A9W9UKS0_PENBR|nr:hypothetical protein N7452_002518 [Penicillium brevicompactum]
MNTFEASRPSRRARACKQCRTAKVRCSGSRPCARCTRRRDTCVFPADEAHVSVPERYLQDLQREVAQFKALSSEGTSTTPRPPNWRGSVSASDPDPPAITPTSLDTRARAIRNTDLLTPNSLPRRNIDSNNLTTRDSLGLAEPTTRPNNRDQRESSNLPEAYNPLVARDVAYVSGSDDRRLCMLPSTSVTRLIAYPGRLSVFLGHTSTWSFCRRVFKLLEDDVSYPTTHRAPLNLDGTAFRLRWQPKTEVDSNDLVRLPPVDHALLLYNTVKFRLGELFGIVDEKNFLRIFDEFHQNPLKTAQTHLLWFIKYLMVIAFGKALISYPKQTTASPSGPDLATRALSLLPDVAFLQDERPALLSIEVCALIALYFQSVDMRSPAYQYIGQALRLAFHDGLHRRLSEDVMDPDITTRCSNVWWTIYVIDQELTAGLGCPPTIPLNSITMPLPDIQSLSMPTKALALRSRLSQINSMIYSTIYSFDDNTGPDFVSSITSVLHKLAEVSREIDEVTSSFKVNGGELPHIFYGITLSHHHCIVLATRPLVIWLLIRSVTPITFDLRLLSRPIAKLLEKSVQSATTSLRILSNMLDREMLETFLPFPLEYAFSSAVLLSILSAILPTYVLDSGWHSAMSAVFEEMIRKGNVVAKLRMAELTHLEALLDAQRRQVSMASLQSFSVPRYTSDSASTSQLLSNPNLGHEAQCENHSNSFEVGWNDSDGFLDPFETGSEDILALAEQLEHDDFSFPF